MISHLIFNGKTHIVNPLYDTESIERDLSYNYGYEVSSVEFSDKDADLIISQNYETEFELYDGVRRYKFYYRNCVIGRKARIVTASKIEPIGPYYDVKSLLETEVNIADNKYKKKVLKIPYAPMIQFYLGGGRLTTIVNDIVFDTDTSGDPTISTNPQGGDNGWYAFRNVAVNGVNTIIHVQSTDSDINGYYSPSGVGIVQANKWANGVVQNRSIRWINDTGSGNANTYVLIDPASPNTWLYRTDPIYTYPNNPMWDESTAFGDPIVMYNPNDVTDKILVYSIANPKFRVLMARDNYPDWNVKKLGFDDTVPNSAYTHALIHRTSSQYNQLYDVFGFNGEKSDQKWVFSELFDPDRGVYGKASEDSILYPNQYFVKPVDDSNTFAMMSNYWKFASCFYTISDEARLIIAPAYGEQEALFYDFEDVLSQMTGLPITSMFLSGLSPLKDNRKLYLAPLSNIKVRDYVEPAKKQILTALDLFTFLENTYGCYWDVRPKELRIENYLFYDNGGSYVSNIISSDLIGDVNAWNEKQIESEEFSFITGIAKKYTTWKFQNDHNVLYEGELIINNSYVEDGKNEKTVGKMNIDLVSVILNDVSNDGVLVIEVDQNDNIIFEGKLINGGLAMSYAIPRYHMYGVGGTDTNYGVPLSKMRLKEEEITHNIDLSDLQGLIRTTEGLGKINSITIDNQKVSKIKLHHDEY